MNSSFKNEIFSLNTCFNTNWVIAKSTNWDVDVKNIESNDLPYCETELQLQQFIETKKNYKKS